jgi:hypothetical protein
MWLMVSSSVMFPLSGSKQNGFARRKQGNKFAALAAGNL